MSEQNESEISAVNIIDNYNNQNITELNTNFIYLDKLEERARDKLIKRYEQPSWFYNEKVINDILFNEKTHYVEMFKEYLLYEDYNEFLRQYYGKPLLITKLQKILDFYEKYSKIFPNYTALRESKYLYKNIKRKQKVINQINENKRNENLEEDSDASYKITIFNSRVINSIYTGHNTINVNKNNDTLLTNNKSISNFIEQISIIEKESDKIKEHKKNIKVIKINNNSKKNGNLILKKLTNILVNSPNYNNNIKTKTKNDYKKNIIDKHLYINNKMVLNPYNYISKQKSLSNLIHQNKKINSSFKHDNNNNFSRKNINNINNNSLMGKTNGLKYYLDFQKYKKILISTNISNTPKIFQERMLSSPKRMKNIKFIKKRCTSNSKLNNNNINRNINNTNVFNNKNNKSKNNRNTYNKNEIKDEKKLIKCQINNKSKYKLSNQESLNKNNNNISSFSERCKNMRKNNTMNNKNKIVNNFNITNGIMNNSTQINIYTGNNLIKSLNLYWNSIINSTKPNSPMNEKQLGTKTISKKMKKMKNMKQFFIKQMKEKKMIKEPHTERNSSNEKLLKLLDIYCNKTKKNRNTNIKKNKSILNKSNNYKTKSKTKCEEKTLLDFINKKK